MPVAAPSAGSRFAPVSNSPALRAPHPRSKLSAPRSGRAQSPLAAVALRSIPRPCAPGIPHQARLVPAPARQVARARYAKFALALGVAPPQFLAPSIADSMHLPDPEIPTVFAAAPRAILSPAASPRRVPQTKSVRKSLAPGKPRTVRQCSFPIRTRPPAPALFPARSKTKPNRPPQMRPRDVQVHAPRNTSLDLRCGSLAPCHFQRLTLGTSSTKPHGHCQASLPSDRRPDKRPYASRSAAQKRILAKASPNSALFPGSLAVEPSAAAQVPHNRLAERIAAAPAYTGAEAKPAPPPLALVPQFCPHTGPTRDLLTQPAASDYG